MDPLKSFERRNAQEWDDVSDVGSVAPSEHPEVPSAQLRGPNIKASPSRPTPSPRAPARDRVEIVQPRSSPAPAYHGTLRGSAPAFQSPQRTNYRAPSHVIQSRPDPGQLRVPNIGAPVQRVQGRPPRAPLPPLPPKWAEMTPLQTTRKAEALEEKRLKEEEDKQYKQAPDNKEYFPSIAYYLWPSNKKGQGPRDILGTSLEALDKIRVENKVFVWPMSDGTCLKICSRATDESSNELHLVIHAIRQVIRHNHALLFAAEPTLIAIPPTADAMTTIVKPIKGPRGLERPYSTIGVMLGEEKLAEKEKLDWDSKYQQRVQTYHQKLGEKLIGALNGLQTYRGWMRMRVRFGHVIFHNPMNRFTRGSQWWEDFEQMISAEHLKSTLDAEFDDPNVIKLLRDMILENPDQFRPADGRSRTLPLGDIPFKFTEIIFLETPSGKSRMEVEIDVTSETTEGVYQVGSMRAFNGDNRNKRLQMTIVDPQKQLDWALDIVTDNEIDDTPSQLLKMAQESVDPRTRIRYDATGAPYPEVRPMQGHGFRITEVVVKSVIEYALHNTDYIVELTLFRTWLGNDTTCEPTLSASVAIYHKDWDEEMSRLTPTDGDRNWPRPLKTFFSSGVEKDDTDIGSMGVKKFFVEVGRIQGMLLDAVEGATALAIIRNDEEEALQYGRPDTSNDEAIAVRLQSEQVPLEGNRSTEVEALRAQLAQASIFADIRNGATRDQGGRGPATQKTTNEASDDYEDLYSAD